MYTVHLRRLIHLFQIQIQVQIQIVSYPMKPVKNFIYSIIFLYFLLFFCNSLLEYKLRPTKWVSLFRLG